MNYIEVLPLDKLPEGSQKVVALGVVKIALFHFNGEISGFNYSCW